MTYLKILSYARRGIRAEIEQNREMQSKALQGAGAYPEAKKLADGFQAMIDALEVDMATLDELQEIHDRE